jgi:alpha-tubulin suppressor-like RCC1 family protein
MLTPNATLPAAKLRSHRARALAAALTGALLLAGSAFVHAASYQYRIPIPGLKVVEQAPPVDDEVAEPLAFSLTAQTLPPATRGESYSFDFRTLLTMTGEPQPPMSSVSWLAQGTLPGGLSFSEDGVLSGAPSTLGEKSFEVAASFEGAQGQQTYTIVVNGAPLEVAQIAAGDTFSCALLLNRTVKCWGSNAEGRLGDGTVSNRTAPVPVANLANVAVLVGGNTHTCALLTDETVKCWGSNAFGQLGDGTTQVRTAPVSVNLQGVKAIAAGYDVTCALLSGGNVSCWGRNNEGQLGNGLTTNSSNPVNTALTGVISIGVGYQHACAVLSDRTVKCWGRNADGELGNGTRTSSKSPVFVKDPWGNNLQSTRALALRSSHTCALSTGGIVRCWGFNGNGRVGNGGNTVVTTATQVLDSASSVSVGSSHTCATLTNATVRCWGRNHVGQLGIGSTDETGAYSPVIVPSLTGVIAVGLGNYHTCAVLTDGTAKCWGENSASQVGDGTQSNRPAPVMVRWGE